MSNNKVIDRTQEGPLPESERRKCPAHVCVRHPNVIEELPEGVTLPEPVFYTRRSAEKDADDNALSPELQSYLEVDS